jgi:NPCBM/NEW2 domain
MLAPAFVLLTVTPGAGPGGFEVRTAGEGRAVVEVQSVAADGTITLAGGKAVPGADWYSLRRLPTLLPPWPRGPHAELVNGDRVAGAVASADGDAARLRVSLPGRPDQALRLPLSAVRAVWLTGPPDGDDPDWLAAPRKRDVIRSRNGDVAQGALTGIDAGQNAVRYQADGKEQQLELARVAVIGFNTDLARARRPKGPYYRLTLADGTRLSATAVTFDGTSWTAQTLFKEALKVPADQLVSVDVEQGKAVYLANLKPVKYQYQSYDSEEYAWAADRCVSGQAMRLKTARGESTFDRGLGLHADCTINYALGGKYRRFEALAGLDARSGLRGDATLVVLVDGKELGLPGGGRLTPAAAPLAVEIDVTGAKELTIAVRRGAGGNVQDCVDLAEARLVP